MRFETIHCSREHRYALERDTETGKPVFSIPVRNQYAEYEEYYDISEAELEHLLANENKAVMFAKQCGQRMHDLRLILRPGLERGYY